MSKFPNYDTSGDSSLLHLMNSRRSQDQDKRHRAGPTKSAPTVEKRPCQLVVPVAGRMIILSKAAARSLTNKACWRLKLPHGQALIMAKWYILHRICRWWRCWWCRYSCSLDLFTSDRSRAGSRLLDICNCFSILSTCHISNLGGEEETWTV